MKTRTVALVICGVLVVAIIAILGTRSTHPNPTSVPGTVLYTTTLPDASQLVLIASEYQEIGKRGVGWHQMVGTNQVHCGLVGFVDSRADLSELAFTSQFATDRTSVVIWQQRPERFVVLHASLTNGKWTVSDFGSDEVKVRAAKQIAEDFTEAPKTLIGPLRSMGSLYGP